MSDLSGVAEALQELIGDNTVPQNVRLKLTKLLSGLKDPSQDIGIRVNKILDELENISNDANLPAYTRTQIWNISSMLEMIM